MECVHHYVLKSGNPAIGQCKYCSEIRTFDNEYQIKGRWVNPAAAQAAKENAPNKNRVGSVVIERDG